MEEHTHTSTNLTCFGWRATLRCSAAHVGAQLGQVPSEKCSGWLPKELEKGHAACSLLKLFQKTRSKNKEEKKDTVYLILRIPPRTQNVFF